MKTNITGLITDNGKTLGPIAATTRHMTLELVGRVGTLTGSISVNGDFYTDLATLEVSGANYIFGVDVNAAGTLVKITATGTIISAYLITEG